MHKLWMIDIDVNLIFYEKNWMKGSDLDWFAYSHIYSGCPCMHMVDKKMEAYVRAFSTFRMNNNENHFNK